METGENIQALRRILDFLRMGSIVLLLLHFYCVCYPAMQQWDLTVAFVDRVAYNLAQQSLFFHGVHKPKVLILLLLCISLIGVKGKKDTEQKLQPILLLVGLGLCLFFLSFYILEFHTEPTHICTLYSVFTSLGYIFLLTGGTKISRILRLQHDKDIFNDLNETFPQEERLITNEYSVNLPTEYVFKNKKRKGYINLVSIFRGTFVSGTPGSGKSFWVIRGFITQLAARNFCFFLYDFKFPDQTTLLYNHVLKNAHNYKRPPKFYVINFDDLSRTHRCNVLYPQNMFEVTDAMESSRTLMMALNREFIKKQGDFFVESPILFVSAIFWFLKKYEGGRFCTLPHAIELAMIEYQELFAVLSMEKEIELLINPFISAFTRNATDQLEGQIASAKISLAKLVSPNLYYVLSGSDFNLDINNPEDPKVVCVGNNPSKSATYGAVLSLYVERMHKLVNRKNQLPCALIYDEYPTLFASVDLISTARSNRIAVLVGVQDMSQLVRDYGKEQAEVVVNICGNIISGQVLGESAKALSERIGKINQQKESVSINANDTSLSKSTQLDSAIPVSRISNLSSGEFVGAVADSPQQPIKQKVFHCRIINDFEAIRKEEAEFKEIPVIRQVDEKTVMHNYYQIKNDIRNLIDTEMEKIRGSPTMKKWNQEQQKKNPGSSI